MKFKNLLFSLIIIATPSIFGMSIEQQALQRALQIVKHLCNAPRPITQAQPYRISLELLGDAIIGKHRHLFNLLKPFIDPR